MLVVFGSGMKTVSYTFSTFVSRGTKRIFHGNGVALLLTKQRSVSELQPAHSLSVRNKNFGGMIHFMTK